jgi:hypothetical protein
VYKTGFGRVTVNGAVPVMVVVKPMLGDVSVVAPLAVLVVDIVL